MNKEKDTIEQLIHVIIEVRRLILQHVENSFEERNSTLLQYETMDMLHMKNQAMMKEIASYLNISMSSGTQLINRMITRGFVERVLDRHDRRVIYIRLTSQGEKMIQETRKNLTVEFEKVFKQLSQSDRETFLHIQQKIVGILLQEV